MSTQLTQQQMEELIFESDVSYDEWMNDEEFMYKDRPWEDAEDAEEEARANIRADELYYDMFIRQYDVSFDEEEELDENGDFEGVEDEGEELIDMDIQNPIDYINNINSMNTRLLN